MVQGWLLRGSEREPPAAGVLREHPGTERVPKTGHCESVPALKECRNQGHCESAPALRECRKKGHWESAERGSEREPGVGGSWVGGYSVGGWVGAQGCVCVCGWVGAHARVCVCVCVGGWVGGRAGGTAGGWVGGQCWLAGGWVGRCTRKSGRATFRHSPSVKEPCMHTRTHARMPARTHTHTDNLKAPLSSAGPLPR